MSEFILLFFFSSPPYLLLAAALLWQLATGSWRHTVWGELGWGEWGGGAGEFVFGGEVYDPAEFSWFLVEPLEESPIVFLFLFFFRFKNTNMT